MYLKLKEKRAKKKLILGQGKWVYLIARSSSEKCIRCSAPFENDLVEILDLIGQSKNHCQVIFFDLFMARFSIPIWSQFMRNFRFFSAIALAVTILFPIAQIAFASDFDTESFIIRGIRVNVMNGEIHNGDSLNDNCDYGPGEGPKPGCCYESPNGTVNCY